MLIWKMHYNITIRALYTAPVKTANLSLLLYGHDHIAKGRVSKRKALQMITELNM